MDCRRAEELFSDDLEGTLSPILRAELASHLGACARCRELRDAVAEVCDALRAFPDLEPPARLAERAAAAALARPRALARPQMPLAGPLLVRPAIPAWIHAAAAGFALIVLGTALLLIGPEAPTRAAQRLVSRTVSAGSQILERKDRLVEDVRILGVVIGTAFEGRLERMNDRVEDYRRLLERRKNLDDADEKKRGSRSRSLPPRLASGFRTPPFRPS
jgi:hypothetical protein